TCKEKSVNARIADERVWKKIAELMSSPELLVQHAERWFKKQEKKVKTTSVDIAVLEREIAKLKKQEARYGKAYGAGVFDLEQLDVYMTHVREKIGELEGQIAHVKKEADNKRVGETPSKEEIEGFTQKAQAALQDLNFKTKRAIVLSTIE